jgi:hypothetical protein
VNGSLFVIHNFLILLFFSSHPQASNLSGDLVGSAEFVRATEGTLPWSDSLKYARTKKSNIYFSNRRDVYISRTMPTIQGPHERQQWATADNYDANYTMTAASSDSRSPAYIDHALLTALESHGSGVKKNPFGYTDAQTKVSQAGDKAQKYLIPEILDPKVGYFQSVDNQQAFRSTWDNIVLGEAEQSLFKGDQASAIKYFKEKLGRYKEGTGKQMDASKFQKGALLRSKNTADMFANFFTLKRDVTAFNLSRMPTAESMEKQCNFLMDQKDKNHVYRFVMKGERNLSPAYNFTLGDIGDLCGAYINNEKNYLLVNEHLHAKLEKIIQDSDKMAKGLKAISQQLSQRGLSIEQVAKILQTSEAWKELGERDAAWQECQKSNCFSEQKNAIGSMVKFKGHQQETHPNNLKFENIIGDIISSGKIGEQRSIDLAGFNYKEIKPGKSSSQKMKKARFWGKTKLKENKTHLKEKKGGNQIAGVDGNKDINYEMSKANFNLNSGSYFRDKDGVLRAPSGKPVKGYHSPSYLPLFEIITNRYHKKYFTRSDQ